MTSFDSAAIEPVTLGDGTRNQWIVVQTLHTVCDRCDDAILSAIAHAKATGSSGATYTVDTVATPPEWLTQADHSATVVRLMHARIVEVP